MSPPSTLAQLAILAAALTVLSACGGGGGASSLAIVSAPPGQVAAGDAYAYQIEVENAQGAVSFTLAIGPPGLLVSAVGRVEWSPVYASLGVHAVSILVRDSAHQRTHAWTLRVHQGLDLGVTLSPRGHTSHSTNQDFIDHFSGNAPWGRIIAFHSVWRDSVASAGTIPQLALTGVVAAQTFGFTPAIGFGWSSDGVPDLTSESDPLENSWFNQETRDEFLLMVTSFAASWRPPYLFLGNETNVYYVDYLQKSAPEWDAWLAVFEEAYDAIHAVSPDTMVFTTFQLEWMMGQGAATSGWPHAADWTPLEDHAASGKIDALGFTTYPYFEYAAPSAIPPGHYDGIAARWSGPVVFTETGWKAQAHPPWPGSEADQADFVPRFFELTRDLDILYASWLLLHDWDGQAAVIAFSHIGLRDNLAAVVRPSDAAWRAEVSLRQR